MPIRGEHMLAATLPRGAVTGQHTFALALHPSVTRLFGR